MWEKDLGNPHSKSSVVEGGCPLRKLWKIRL